MIAEWAQVMMDERVHKTVAGYGSVAARSSGVRVAAGAGGFGHGSAAAAASGNGFPGKGRGRRMVCYECGGEHPVKYCKERKVRCWKSGMVGHVASL